MRHARRVCVWLFILGLFHLICLSIPTLAQSVATITVENASAQSGETVIVPINATNVQDPIVGIQGSLSFDPTVVNVTGLTFNPAFQVKSYNILTEIEIQTGSQRLGVVHFVATLVMDSEAPIGLGDGTLFTFDATAVGNPGDTSPLDLTLDLVKNMGHEVLIITVIDGTFTIIGGGGTNVPPIAEFTCSPTNPQVNQKVNFTDNSRDPDGFIVSWFWDFGDGTTLEVQTESERVMHTYTMGGNYTVTLTVTDNRAATGTTTKALAVGAKHGGPEIYVFPNPCRTLCSFYYEFPNDTTSAALRMFNIRGQLVFSKTLDLNTNQFRWDMRDDFGRPLPNGPYFFFAFYTTGQGVMRTPLDVLVIKK